MGLLNFLFGPKVERVDDPDRLRELLFEAAAAGEQAKLLQLCKLHRGLITEHFPTWQKVPDDVRADPVRTQRLANGLIAVAETFARRLNCPDLVQLLVGKPEDNPIVRWEKALRTARSAMEALRYGEAWDALEDLLIDTRDLQGTGAEHYVALTYGQLGTCYFQTGAAEKAVGALSNALELCERQGDAAGVVAYLEGLCEVHRYLNQAAPASEFAERLYAFLEKQGQPEKAGDWKTRAEVIRAGEPLNRVVAEFDGRRFELDQLPAFEHGRVSFLFERNRPTLQPALVLTERGKKLGSEGRYDEAIDLFREASAADPFDPDSWYQGGVTLAYLERYVEAIESYEQTEALAPGWYHVRADLWMARQVALGRVEHEVFLASAALEDSPFPPKEKADLARQILEKAKDLAGVHLQLGKSLADLGLTKEAEAELRAGLACVSEPDVETRLLVQLAALLQVGSERTALLQKAVELEGNLVASATAKVMLAQASRRKR
jgi:tetratricopeptide (TPR) repeat protein